jgi:hypothetical protein
MDYRNVVKIIRKKKQSILSLWNSIKDEIENNQMDHLEIEP